MNKILFKFIHGFGNRLCNLMNMFYIHEKYPETLIFINWVINNHCGIHINDIIDLKEHSFILSYDDYEKNKSAKDNTLEIWASTSANEITKWDNIEEWKKHKYIVSVSFHLYSFVTTEYCRNIFNSCLVFKEDITNIVKTKTVKYGVNKKIIHFRNGDLLHLLSINESLDNVNSIIEKVELLNKDYFLFEYNQFKVDRNYNDVLESIADLIYLSKYNNVIGYCPYSHFSSWIFVLSSNFIDNNQKYPIFNYKIIDIIVLEDKT